MRKHTSAVICFSVVLASALGRAEPSVAAALLHPGPGWERTIAPSLRSSLREGILEMTSQEPAQFAVGQWVLSSALTAGPNTVLHVRVQLRVRQAAQDAGSTGRIELVQGSSWMNFGVIAGHGVAVQVQRDGQPLTQTILSNVTVDEQWHQYEVTHDGESARFFLDGRLVATTTLHMDHPQVWLQVHTRYNAEGTVQGAFRNLQLW